MLPLKHILLTLLVLARTATSTPKPTIIITNNEESHARDVSDADQTMGAREAVMSINASLKLLARENQCSAHESSCDNMCISADDVCCGDGDGAFCPFETQCVSGTTDCEDEDGEHSKKMYSSGEPSLSVAEWVGVGIGAFSGLAAIVVPIGICMYKRK